MSQINYMHEGKFFAFHTQEAHNFNFVERVESLLEDYFSPEKINSLTDYVPIDKYNEDLAVKFTPNSENQENIFAKLDAKINFPKGLGAYEEILFSHFIHGKMTAYVISGAMGSGKSTTLNYVFQQMQNDDEHKNNILIKLDFNEGYDYGQNIDELVELFLEDFFHRIKVEIIRNISKHNIAHEFLLHTQTKDHYQKFSKFFDLSFDKINNDYDIWKAIDEPNKLFKIFEYIQSMSARIDIRIDMVMRFLSFVGKNLNDNHGIKTIIFYDNLDKLPPAAQRNILNKIISFNQIAEIKTIITIRRSTKAKLDKLIAKEHEPLFPNRAQTVYGHIYHHGPSPKVLYLNRLEYLIGNINKIELFAPLSVNEKNLILLRSKEIIKKLKGKNIFENVFSSISGESNRLGLTLAHRPFCNYIIPCDEESPNLQSLSRTLLIGRSNTNRMDPRDNYVANLFADSDHSFTYINLIILYFIHESSTDVKLSKFRKVSRIYDVLFNVFGYSSQEIIYSLNFLLSDKRALLGGEYFPKYEKVDDIQREGGEKLRITELGYRYLNHLYNNDNIYIQSCLLSLQWDFINEYQVQKDTILERFKDLRLCLKYIRDHEGKLYDNLTYHIPAGVNNNLPFTWPSITVHVTKMLIHAFLAISPSIPNQYHLNEELESWKDMMLFWSKDFDDFYEEIDLIDQKLN